MSISAMWHCFYGSVDDQRRRKILESLAKEEIPTVATEGPRADLPGVIFFEMITPELCDRLQAASRRGIQRVLAVGLTQECLQNGKSWQLLQFGASDVLHWRRTEDTAKEIAARFKRWQQVDEILHSSLVLKNIAGASLNWIRVLRQVVEVARFTDASVLISGESGTGKELIARLIHTLDCRADKRDLVITDCTTVVPELSGSEFFGHERGAFTGAQSARDGAFALANGGTLFLDEIGELPLSLQAELLRAVQERTYKRVGSNHWQRSEFRLISATNRDLIEEQKKGLFRSDFYYRITGWVCHLPALRERQEDILSLARYFIEQARPDDPPPLDHTVCEYLVSRDYPGNIRDLKQLITRMLCRHVGPGPISAGDIPEMDRPRKDVELADWRQDGFDHSIHCAITRGIKLKEIGRAAEEVAERIALEAEAGNLQRAAARLGLTDRALQLRRAARRQSEMAEE